VKVYLAGPIKDTTDEEMRAWRQIAREYLGADHVLDPSDRDYRGVEDENIERIVEGDKDDIRRSNAVLANYWRPGAGTAMEILFAWEQCRPVVTVVPPGAVSPWIRYHSDVVVHSLGDGLREIERIVAPRRDHPPVLTGAELKEKWRLHKADALAAAEDATWD